MATFCSVVTLDKIAQTFVSPEFPNVQNSVDNADISL